MKDQITEKINDFFKSHGMKHVAQLHAGVMSSVGSSIELPAGERYQEDGDAHGLLEIKSPGGDHLTLIREIIFNREFAEYETLGQKLDAVYLRIEKTLEVAGGIKELYNQMVSVKRPHWEHQVDQNNFPLIP